MSISWKPFAARPSQGTFASRWEIVVTRNSSDELPRTSSRRASPEFPCLCSRARLRSRSRIELTPKVLVYVHLKTDGRFPKTSLPEEEAGGKLFLSLPQSLQQLNWVCIASKPGRPRETKKYENMKTNPSSSGHGLFRHRHAVESPPRPQLEVDEQSAGTMKIRLRISIVYGLSLLISRGDMTSYDVVRRIVSFETPSPAFREVLEQAMMRHIARSQFLSTRVRNWQMMSEKEHGIHSSRRDVAFVSFDVPVCPSVPTFDDFVLMRR